MRFNFKSLLLIVAALAVTAHAQQTKPLIVSDTQPVRNDDGGQAFIIDRDLKPLVALGSARKGAISEPQQHSIFVGSGWSDPKLSDRETTLGSLLANVRDESTIEAMHALGIKNRFGPTINAEQTDINAGVFRDLDAQRLLATMISSGALARPNGKTVYVIFLDSTLQSTLGTLMAGKHYVAYHSAFNSSGMNIRYVVVPFESDAPRGYDIALRAFVAAATRPARLAK